MKIRGIIGEERHGHDKCDDESRTAYMHDAYVDAQEDHERRAMVAAELRARW